MDLGRTYHALRQYVAYLSLSAQVHLGKLTQEIDALPGAVEQRHFTTEEQRTLARLLEDVRLLDGLAHTKLSPDDFRAYDARRAALTAESLWSKLQALSSKPSVNQSQLEQFLAGLSTWERFYDVAHQRDEAFVRNTLTLLDQHSKLRAPGSKLQVQLSTLLITGGFHTAGLTQHFQDHSIAYAVITPSSTGALDERRYQARLQNTIPPVEELFQKLTQMNSQALVPGLATDPDLRLPSTEPGLLPPAVGRTEDQDDGRMSKHSVLFRTYLKLRSMMARSVEWLRVWIHDHPNKAALYGIALAVVGKATVVSLMGQDFEFTPTDGTLLAMASGVPPGPEQPSEPPTPAAPLQRIQAELEAKYGDRLWMRNSGRLIAYVATRGRLIAHTTPPSADLDEILPWQEEEETDEEEYYAHIRTDEPQAILAEQPPMLGAHAFVWDFRSRRGVVIRTWNPSAKLARTVLHQALRRLGIPTVRPDTLLSLRTAIVRASDDPSQERDPVVRDQAVTTEDILKNAMEGIGLQTTAPTKPWGGDAHEAHEIRFLTEEGLLLLVDVPARKILDVLELAGKLEPPPDSLGATGEGTRGGSATGSPGAGEGEIGEGGSREVDGETLHQWVAALDAVIARLNDVSSGGAAPTRIVQELSRRIRQLRLLLPSYEPPSFEGATSTPSTVKITPQAIAEILSITDSLRKASLMTADESSTIERLSAQLETAARLPSVKNRLSAITSTLTQSNSVVKRPTTPDGPGSPGATGKGTGGGSEVGRVPLDLNHMLLLGGVGVIGLGALMTVGLSLGVGSLGLGWWGVGVMLAGLAGVVAAVLPWQRIAAYGASLVSADVRRELRLLISSRMAAMSAVILRLMTVRELRSSRIFSDTSFWNDAKSRKSRTSASTAASRPRMSSSPSPNVRNSAESFSSSAFVRRLWEALVGSFSGLRGRRAPMGLLPYRRPAPLSSGFPTWLSPQFLLPALGLTALLLPPLLKYAFGLDLHLTPAASGPLLAMATGGRVGKGSRKDPALDQSRPPHVLDVLKRLAKQYPERWWTVEEIQQHGNIAKGGYDILRRNLEQFASDLTSGVQRRDTSRYNEYRYVAPVDALPLDQTAIELRLLEFDDEIREYHRLLMEEAMDRFGRIIGTGRFGYQTRASSYGQILYQMKRYAGPLFGKRILEVGAGTGAFLMVLDELGLSADGLEGDPQLVDWARDVGLVKTMVQGDLISPPPAIMRKPCDVTYSRNVLDVIAIKGKLTQPVSPEVARRVLRRIAELTKPGGISIHQVEWPFPFKEQDIREAGFKVLDGTLEQKFIVLRRRPELQKEHKKPHLGSRGATGKGTRGGSEVGLATVQLLSGLAVIYAGAALVPVVGIGWASGVMAAGLAVWLPWEQIAEWMQDQFQALLALSRPAPPAWWPALLRPLLTPQVLLPVLTLILLRLAGVDVGGAESAPLLAMAAGMPSGPGQPQEPPAAAPPAGTSGERSTNIQAPSRTTEQIVFDKVVPIEEGATVTREIPSTVSGFAAETYRELEAELEKNGLLALERPVTGLSIAEQIGWVLGGLLRNAADATVARWGTEYSRAEIRLRALIRDGELWFQVTDNGIGIAPHVAARIGKEPFTTWQHSDVLGGVGNDLALMMPEVQKFGWRLNVMNREDTQGAIASLIVPLHDGRVVVRESVEGERSAASTTAPPAPLDSKSDPTGPAGEGQLGAEGSGPGGKGQGDQPALHETGNIEGAVRSVDEIKDDE